MNLHIDVPSALVLQVKVSDLWAQARLHLRIHLMTRLHQLQSQVHVISGQAVVSAESQRARKKTHQMILDETDRVLLWRKRFTL